MKTFILILASLSLPFGLAIAKTSLQGAYHAKIDNTNHLWIFQDHYCSYIEYEDNHFLKTWGGPYKVQDGQIKVQVEYDTGDIDNVGVEARIPVTINQNTISSGTNTWTKQDDQVQALDGLWRITGRKQEESKDVANIPKGDRKTIKILSNGYFQWIAINPAVKGFYGTGGGKYSFKNNTYTEDILFFSRDDSRVGHTLTFKGEIVDTDHWHHSGLSSKGDPIYEIWSRED